MNYFEPTRLIFARQLRGISRKQLSVLAEMPRATIRAFEQRDYSCLPAHTVVEEIALALSFPVSWFYQDEIELRPPNRFSWLSGSQSLDGEIECAAQYKVSLKS